MNLGTHKMFVLSKISVRSKNVTDIGRSDVFSGKLN